MDRTTALRKPDDVCSYRVPSIAQDVDSLFTAARAPEAAGWRGYLKQHVDGPVEDLLTASASGVLMVPARRPADGGHLRAGATSLGAHAIEQDFGLKVVLKHLGGACLDPQLVYDGGPDSMEVCDILPPSAGLIHVNIRGSSSTLSHLFSQGVNSAERLLQDADFREKMLAVVERVDSAFSPLVPADRPDPADHEITFVVITRSLGMRPDSTISRPGRRR